MTYEKNFSHVPSKNIVNAANSVIDKNKSKISKEVWTDNEDGELISIKKSFSDNEEGKIVSNLIFEEKIEISLQIRILQYYIEQIVNQDQLKNP